MMHRTQKNKTLSLVTSVFLQSTVAALFTLALMNEVVKLGHFIPQPDLPADYLFGLLWAFTLGIGILAFPFIDRDRGDLLILWSAKVLVALFAMLFYENHYRLDAYGYFRSGVGSIHLDPVGGAHFGTSTAFMFHLTALYESLIVSFHAIKISFAMVGLAGIYVFYRAAV